MQLPIKSQSCSATELSLNVDWELALNEAGKLMF
jgi:hypothetical protein